MATAAQQRRDNRQKVHAVGEFDQPAYVGAHRGNFVEQARTSCNDGLAVRQSFHDRQAEPLIKRRKYDAFCVTIEIVSDAAVEVSAGEALDVCYALHVAADDFEAFEWKRRRKNLDGSRQVLVIIWISKQKNPLPG